MGRYLVLVGFGILTACSGSDPAQKISGTPATGGNAGGGGAAGTSVATSRVALDVQTFCKKVITTCGATGAKESDCEAMFGAVRVTQDCATALENASCSDLAGGTGPVASCFPSCSTPGTQSCNGDGTLSVCGNASKALVYDCKTTCTEVGKSGSGKCGTATSSDGQSSQTEKCLCD